MNGKLSKQIQSKRLPSTISTVSNSESCTCDSCRVEEGDPVSGSLNPPRLAALLAQPAQPDEVVECYTLDDFSPEELGEIFADLVSELKREFQELL